MKAWAYKDYRIGELFEIKKGKRLTKANMENGDIAFIGASSDNHGRTAKIANSSHIHGPNLITVSYNGSVGEAFYQTDKFWASDDINVLYPKFTQDEKIALYLCSCLRKRGKGYGYNFKWSKELMEADYITLPITKSGLIDFAYMQDRIQEMEQARIQEMDAYLKVAGFEDCELTVEEGNVVENLSKHQFENFNIGSVFDIDTGRDVIIGRVKDGAVPLISHQHDNNGISKRIELLDYRTLFDYSKTISLADRGIFYATTQIENFHIGTRVKALTFKNGAQNELVRLFFVTAINKLQILFTDYLVNATDKLPTLKIQLPVNDSGDIDYEFMETYIRAQEKLAIQRVKNWRAKEIEATKDIVYARPDQAAQQSVSCYIISSSDVTSSQRYITHLPIYPLRAACGYFDANGSLPEEEAEGWIDVRVQMNKLDKGMFIVHAEGQSMEPKIHDGDLCVFNSSAAGSRQGKIVLVKARDISDPSASSFTIKKYSSQKVSDEDNGWRHIHITLSPLNPNYRSIEISAEEAEDGEFKIYGEFVQVINTQ